MSLIYIRKTYNTPFAKRGYQVKYGIGLISIGGVFQATIIGASGAHLRIRRNDNFQILIVHPCDENLQYLGMMPNNALAADQNPPVEI